MSRKIDRRRLIAGSSALAGAAVLGGRGVASAQDATPSASPVASPMASPVADVRNTSVSGSVRYSVVGSGPEDVALIQDIFSTTFREIYPELEVSAEPALSGEGDPLLAQMVSGDAPDVFDAWTSRATPYIDAGQVLDLKPNFDRDYSGGQANDIFSWVMDAQSLPSGLQWGMPRYVNLTVLIYNKDMFDAAGLAYPDDSWNQDAYAQALTALTQKNGDATRVYGGHIPVFSYGRFANKVEAWGGTVVDPADDTHATFDSAEAQAAAEWHRVRIVDEKTVADKSFLDTGGGENVVGSRANFVAGRIATMEEGFYPFALADAVGDTLRFGFAAPPAGPAGRPILGSADGVCIWSGSKNLDAAWEVAKFISGVEYQRAFSAATGLIPVRQSLMEDFSGAVVTSRPNLADSDLEVGLALLTTSDPHERPLFKKDAEAEDQINSGLERIFVVGDTPVTFLTELAAAVTEAQRAG